MEGEGEWVFYQRCALGMRVEQIMQDSLGMKRTLAFTPNVMESLGIFEQRRDDLLT